MKIAALALFAAVVSTGTAEAQQLTLKEIQEKGAVRMTKEELLALIPGSTNTNPSFSSTNVRRFEHKADGTVYASATGAFAGSGGRGSGTWSVNDEGRYCVDLTWPGRSGMLPEKWCAAVYKLGDETYAISRDLKAYKHEFKK